MKLFRVSAVVAMVVATVFGTYGIASAKPAPVTKMDFKLQSHDVQMGQPITGSLVVLTRSGHQWVPVAEATVNLVVDGSFVGTAVTDSNGAATVSYTAETSGDHVIKVVFTGDPTHKRAQRAQGFSVSGPPTT